MTGNIFALPGDTGGCGHYRVIRPCSALGQYMGIKPLQSMILPIIEEWARFSPKLLVTQRQTTEEQAQYWEMFRKAYPDTPMVMDFDDLLWNPHPASTYRLPAKGRAALDRSTAAASKIVASTEPLRIALEKRYRRPVTVLPNMLREAEISPPVTRRDPAQKLRVLWAGSDTHRPDLEQLIPAVLQTLDTVDWVFFGYLPPALIGRVEHVPSVPVGRYLSVMKGIGAHVGVAPLVSHAFNECKSNVKILEYGAAGLATIASPVYPYLKSKGLITRSFRPREWVRAVASLQDEETRYAVATSSQEYSRQFLVENHFDQIQTALLG